MPTDRKRVLAVAVASRKIAYVFLIDGELKDWQHSRKGGRSATRGRSFLRTAIARYQPDLVVIEDPQGPTRKYGTSRAILLAMAQDLQDAKVPHLLVTRDQTYANKYKEATVLAREFPPIAPWVPKTPRIWETEPTEMIYFEALALLQAVSMG